MALLIALICLAASIYLILHQFMFKLSRESVVHLPLQALDHDKMALGLLQDKQQDSAWSSLGEKLKGWERYIPLPLAGLRKKIIKAGLSIGIWQFFAFRVLSLVFVPAVAVTLLAKKFPGDTVLIISIVIGFLLPDVWLNNKIKQRHGRIRRELPNIIDLLNLAVNAGLDFMSAVNRVVKDLRPSDLIRELSEVYRETQMGKARREALKNFAERVDMPEVHSFVRTLVQADRMGTPIADALYLQSEEIRVRRFQHGEAMALKAPIKLLFPLFVFILPVVLIIVGGPILLQFMSSGLNLGF